MMPNHHFQSLCIILALEVGRRLDRTDSEGATDIALLMHEIADEENQ